MRHGGLGVELNKGSLISVDKRLEGQRQNEEIGRRLEATAGQSRHIEDYRGYV